MSEPAPAFLPDRTTCERHHLITLHPAAEPVCVKSLLGRPRRRWEGNIRMDLREVGCDPGEWIDLAEDRDQWRAYVRAVMNLRVLKSQLVSYDYSFVSCSLSVSVGLTL